MKGKVAVNAACEGKLALTIVKSWKTTTLGEILTGIEAGKSFKCDERPPTNSETGVMKVSAVTWGSYDEMESKTCLDPQRIEERYFVRDRDFLFSRANTIELVGACVIASNVTLRVMLSDKILRFQFASHVKPSWALHWLRSRFGRSEIERLATGNQESMRNIGQDRIRQIVIRLPTLPEQCRIVAEIEKQFTRLDAGVAALKRVQANLKRYRAAVLKAACEGKLVPTEAELARTGKRKGKFETGEELLARILDERRKNWNGKGKYKEPVKPDLNGLPELPEGWAWVTVDELAEVKGGITKDQKRKFSTRARSVPYLRVANVQRGFLDLSEVKSIVTTEDEIRELKLQEGDVLFNEGGDRDKLGRGWVWNGELPECIHQNHVFRARLFSRSINPKFLSWYSNSFGQKFFFDEGKHTTNLASISMTKLKSLPVPIPPAPEQTRIVAEVERRLSVVEELEGVVAANLQRAQRLRQAVLQKAFEGRLVQR